MREMGCWSDGFSPFDALYFVCLHCCNWSQQKTQENMCWLVPNTCTVSAWCFPRWSLLPGNIYPPIYVADGWLLGLGRWRVGVAPLSCPASPRLAFCAVFLGRLWSLSLLAPVPHIHSVLAMGMALDVRQVRGAAVELQWHTVCCAFFPLDSVFSRVREQLLWSRLKPPIP